MRGAVLRSTSHSSRTPPKSEPKAYVPHHLYSLGFGYRVPSGVLRQRDPDNFIEQQLYATHEDLHKSKPPFYRKSH